MEERDASLFYLSKRFEKSFSRLQKLGKFAHFTHIGFLFSGVLVYANTKVSELRQIFNATITYRGIRISINTSPRLIGIELRRKVI